MHDLRSIDADKLWCLGVHLYERALGFAVQCFK